MEVIKDTRADCFSVMARKTIGDYLDIVERAFSLRGGIDKQRGVLKTRTAQTIRKRMIEDLGRGTVLPPVVLGIVGSANPLDRLDTLQEQELEDAINSVPNEDISIIDGMQRTFALLQAVNADPRLRDRQMRVEYWVAPNTNNLLYRMLLLNTGQVPWNMRRQIEVVFHSVAKEIRHHVRSMDVIQIDERRARLAAGQFHERDLIELFLVFGARKTDVDIRERLADEFTRLDFIEATSDSAFADEFYEVLGFLTALDLAFGKYVAPRGQDHAEEAEDEPDDVSGSAPGRSRFRDGKDLFGSNTARVGFVVAMAEQLFGVLGSRRSYSPEELRERRDRVGNRLNSLIRRLDDMEPAKTGEFLDFDTLKELIASPSAKIGEYERGFFKKAFSLLIEKGDDLDDLHPCWRAP